MEWIKTKQTKKRTKTWKSTADHFIDKWGNTNEQMFRMFWKWTLHWKEFVVMKTRKIYYFQNIPKYNIVKGTCLWLDWSLCSVWWKEYWMHSFIHRLSYVQETKREKERGKDSTQYTIPCSHCVAGNNTWKHLPWDILFISFKASFISVLMKPGNNPTKSIVNSYNSHHHDPHLKT